MALVRRTPGKKNSKSPIWNIETQSRKKYLDNQIRHIRCDV